MLRAADEQQNGEIQISSPFNFPTHPLPKMPTCSEQPTRKDGQKAGGRRETSQILLPGGVGETRSLCRPGARKSSRSPAPSGPHFGFPSRCGVTSYDYVLCFGKGWGEPFLQQCDGDFPGSLVDKNPPTNTGDVEGEVGYSPWGRKQSDMTEQISTAQHRELRPHKPRGNERSLQALQPEHHNHRSLHMAMRSPCATMQSLHNTRETQCDGH